MNSKFATAYFTVLVLLLVSVIPANSQTEEPAAVLTTRTAALQQIVDRAVNQTLERFAASKLQADQLAVTLVDLRRPAQPARASHRGDVQIYPASVIKLFYLVAVHQWLEDGKISETDEIRRALRDMIVLSYNEPAHYLIDLLTGTTSGPELPPDQLEQWHDRRNTVNRYFTGLGYTRVNANRKPWCEGPYGREMQSIRVSEPNHRNWLTTEETARLLTEIVTGQAVTPARSAQMMSLLQRDPFAEANSSNSQARAYTGQALAPGARLWSKAGWTSQTRHDAAYVELPDGNKFVLVTFTTGHANEREIIPTLARAVVAGLSKPD
jgi:beta-lactamase class A